MAITLGPQPGVGFTPGWTNPTFPNYPAAGGAATKTATSPIIPTGIPTNIPGTNPQVPWPTQTQGSAISANIGQLPQLAQLAGGVNQINEAGALNQLQQFLPNYASLVGQASGTTSQELSGQLPSDVVSEILQGAAERGIVTGGGANANAAYLRALGLNSLQMQQQGQSNLSTLIGEAPRAPLFDVGQMLVTPEQQQQAAVAKAIYGSAPPPGAADAANLKAALSGINAGRGPGAPGATASPGTAFGMDMPQQEGTVVGGATNPADPNAAYSNWAAWAAGLPVSQDGSTYDTYNGANASDIGPDFTGAGF